MLNFIHGTAGTGKSTLISQRISEAVSAKKEVIVIVPDQFSFEYNRSLYYSLGASIFNKVTVYGFSHLPAEIFKNVGVSLKENADESVKIAMMFSALEQLKSEKALRFYEKQLSLPTFVKTALELVKVFVSNNVGLENISENLPLLKGDLQEKMTDISIIYATYYRKLSEHGFKDNSTDMTLASEVSRRHKFFENKTIFIDEFRSFTADQYEILHNMILQSDDLHLALTTDNSLSSSYSLFENVNFTVASLSTFAKNFSVKTCKTLLTEKVRFRSDELSFLSENILQHKIEIYGKNTENVAIYEADDLYNEVSYVAAEISRLVASGEYKFSDFAVLSRQKEDYDSIIKSTFKRYDIAYYTDEKTPINHVSVAIFIVTALRLAMIKNPSTEDWLRYAKTGFLQVKTEEISILEDYCYKWSVEKEMWNEPFIIWDDSSDDKTAEEIRGLVTAPIISLRNKIQDTTADKICTAISEFLRETDFNAGFKKHLDFFCESSEQKITELRFVIQVWDEIVVALERIYTLLKDEEISPKRFANLFENILTGIEVSAPPQTLDCVLFSAVNTARLSSPKVVFIIGTNDGILPYAPKQSPYISDKDIENLRKNNIVLSGLITEKTAEEKLVTYYCSTSAAEKIYFTYPVASILGAGLYPSYIIAQLRKMFGDEIIKTSSSVGELFFCRNVASAYYEYVQTFSRTSEYSLALRASLEEINPLFRERFSYFSDIKSRISGGNLSRRNTELLYGKNISMSASRFEDFNKCPFMYFCKKGLAIYPPMKKQMDFATHGNVIHYCLCEILKSFSNRIINLSEKELKEEIYAALTEYYNSVNIGKNFGKTSRFNTEYFMLKDTIFDVLQNIKAEFSASSFAPVGFEYKLSKNGDEPSFVIKAKDGSEIKFEGSIDRIDSYTHDGITYIRVIDYKSSEKKFKLSDLYYGINMQLLLYLFAVTDVNAPLNQGKFHSAVATGALYMPAVDAEMSLKTRNPSLDEIEKARLKSYSKSGVILDEEAVVNAMDKSEKATFIPPNTKTSSSEYFTESELEAVREYSMSYLEDVADKIKGGDISAVPLVDGKNKPCTYCEYKSLCDNYPNTIVREHDGSFAKQSMRETIDQKLMKENSDEKGSSSPTD